MNYGLPETVNVSGVEHPIRADYRAILDILSAINDAELQAEDKLFVMLDIFYADFAEMKQEDYSEAIRVCCDFIDYGVQKQTAKKSPKLIDWEQDFNYIVSPINRVAGHDIRADAFMHWWTFLSYFYEIGDCVLAQIVRIRDALRKGKLDKADREWYEKHRDLVDFETRYTDAEKALLEMWG